VSLEPLHIEFRPDHEYNEVAGETRCRTRMDGVLCMAGPNHPRHRGYAPSTNALGSGDRKAYQSAKKTWSAHWSGLIVPAAEAAGWPFGNAGESESNWSGVGRVMVEIQVGLSQRRDIDADNIGYGTIKPLSDSLVEARIIRKDTMRHFSAGEVTFVVDRQSGPWTHLTLWGFEEPTPWEAYELRAAPEGQETLFAAG
jgi:hypothetical protein